MKYRFFKHGNKWRYRKQNELSVKDIDTFALERVLGVVGGPHVIVVRPYLVRDVKIHVHVENGFISKALLVTADCLSAAAVIDDFQLEELQ